MTDTNLSAFTIPSRNYTRTCIVLVFAASALVSGCGARKRPGIAWSTAILVRPVPAPTIERSGAHGLEAAPELNVELTPPPRLATPRLLPPRPRGASPTNGGAEDNSAIVPLLTPQLSAEETADAQREANSSIGVAEKNLAAVRNRKLTAAQMDLASKARGFLADAKEAARTLDWGSARTLAKKAQVLSQELVGSF